MHFASHAPAQQVLRERHNRHAIIGQDARAHVLDLIGGNALLHGQGYIDSSTDHFWLHGPEPAASNTCSLK